MTLRGLPPVWETFITTIRNNKSFLSFVELVGNITQEESRMISRGIIHKHGEEEPTAFATQDKKMEKGRTSGSKRSSPNSRDSYRRLRDAECFNCHKCVCYAQDHLKNRDSPRPDQSYNK